MIGASSRFRHARRGTLPVKMSKKRWVSDARIRRIYCVCGRRTRIGERFMVQSVATGERQAFTDLDHSLLFLQRAMGEKQYSATHLSAERPPDIVLNL
jgi:hypothetical protein